MVILAVVINVFSSLCPEKGLEKTLHYTFPTVETEYDSPWRGKQGTGK